MEKANKMKSILINESVHSEFKKFCMGRGLKIGTVVEKLIENYIKDPKKFKEISDSYLG